MNPTIGTQTPTAPAPTAPVAAGTRLTLDPRDGLLARKLLDTGVVHPQPQPGHYTARDVTLVVPVKDNPVGLAALLTATGDLTNRVVVDDGSTAPLLHATVRHPKPTGPAGARNRGWRLASTELVAFLHADTHPEPGWLDTLLPHFDEAGVAAVAPRVRSHPGTSSIARYEQRHAALDMGPDPAAVRPRTRISYVPTAALVIRRSALTALGGFDERLRYGEDVDLVWRLAARGDTIRYEPAATVWHAPRPTLGSWLRQRYDYGTSAAPLARRHPGQLACARLPSTSALAALLAATGRPFAALAVTAAITTGRTRELRRLGVPTGAALALTTQTHRTAAGMLAQSVRRTWWPLALLTRRGRRVLLASLLPCLRDAATQHSADPARGALLRILDDLAYSAGVWAGCRRHRTIAPLLPELTRPTP